MTGYLTFPDVSAWQAGMRLPAGTVALMARASQGTYLTDKAFPDFRNQATEMNALFSAYHFLTSEDPKAQAAHHFGIVGPHIPTMIDVEMSINSRPGLEYCLEFARELSALGGHPWAAYFPKWYWMEVGGDLGSLSRAGLALIASDYGAGTWPTAPTAAGFAAYGGATPAILQYTCTRPTGTGWTIDDNAFPGSLDELRALMGVEMLTEADMDAIADRVMQKVWTFSGPDGQGGGPDAPDVHQTLDTARDDGEAIKAQVEAIKAQGEATGFASTKILNEQAAQSANIASLMATVSKIAVKVGA